MSDLEEIIEEMLECISNGSDTWGYTGYFAERIEAARKHVVRCRECKNNVNGACEVFGYYDIPEHENGYCAWGERRDA